MDDFKRDYQFRCPECGSMIRFNRTYYDREIARLGAEITDIHYKLSLCGNDVERKKRLNYAKRVREKERAELKAYRKQANILTQSVIDREFRRLVKELIGKERYVKLAEEAEKNIEYESIESTMKTGYSRKGGKSIISIGKL